jgi:hypothetical protein
MSSFFLPIFQFTSSRRFTLLVMAGTANAQWVVSDPTNFAGNLANSIKELVQTSSTSQNMLNNFNETVKIYRQSKAYYDALKSVHNLVRHTRKVQQTILMVGEISDIYIDNFRRMTGDENFSLDELSEITGGYAKLLDRSGDVLTELKTVVNANGLSMSDAERMAVIDRCHSEVSRYRNLTRYYTDKTIGVSYLRSMKRNETARVLALYGNPTDRYW